MSSVFTLLLVKPPCERFRMLFRPGVVIRYIYVLIHLITFEEVCSEKQIKGDVAVEKNLGPKPARNRFSAGRDTCKDLGIQKLLKLKEKVEKKLTASLNAVEADKSLEKRSQERQIKAIRLFQKEINDTVTLLLESVHGLKRVLKGDYKSLRYLEKTSKKRLEELKKATLIEEEEHNDILLAEKEELIELKRLGHENISKSNTPIRKFVDKLLSDISHAADKLELQLDDDSFQKRFRAKADKFEIETVLRLDEDDATVSSEGGGVTTLIDSHNNQFVLSKPKDGTITHVDNNFLKDIIYIVIFSLALSIPCSWLNVPNLFAYILTGIVLGPSGMNYLKVSINEDLQVVLI